jgi:hypothetical protein
MDAQRKKELLQMEWEEKLAKEGLVPYSKRVN